MRVVAIDIAPANASVHKCDFVTVQVAPLEDPHALYACAPQSSEDISALGAARYDVVVFSLVLSYIPTAPLRYRCCEQARRVLRETGLLIIMEPDSNHVGKNAARIKAWKLCIEALGFRRWRYEKVGTCPLCSWHTRRPSRSTIFCPARTPALPGLQGYIRERHTGRHGWRALGNACRNAHDSTGPRAGGRRARARHKEERRRGRERERGGWGRRECWCRSNAGSGITARCVVE